MSRLFPYRGSLIALIMTSIALCSASASSGSQESLDTVLAITISTRPLNLTYYPQPMTRSSCREAMMSELELLVNDWHRFGDESVSVKRTGSDEASVVMAWSAAPSAIADCRPLRH